MATWAHRLPYLESGGRSLPQQVGVDGTAPHPHFVVHCARTVKSEGLMTALDRITRDPALMGGRPCVRGMRVTVGMIVGQIGAGVTIDELLVDYPYLEREDILQALRYAAWLAEEREITLATA
jgi:uncharacterized protein (DUF433 family)